MDDSRNRYSHTASRTDRKGTRVGFDTNTVAVGMLETGEIDTLIVQNPFAIGYLGVKNAAELISGESISEKGFTQIRLR